MKYRLKKHISAADKICVIFFAAYLLIRLFVADTDNMSASYMSRIVVPYFSQEKGVLLMLLHCIALAGLAIYQKIKIDMCTVILLIRIPIYFIPLAYCTGEFQWGVALAVILTCTAYIIGRGYHGSTKTIVNCFLIASLVLCLQIFATLLINRISIFTEVGTLKWYMILPGGQTNSLGAFLVISFVVIDAYYTNHKKIVYKYIYLFVILAGIFGTGTRSAFLVIAFYYAMKLIKYVMKRNSGGLKRRTLGIIGIGIVVIVVFVLRFGDQIVAKI